MRPWAEEHFANPHSPSRGGREAAAAIEVARDQVESAIGLSGGSLAFTGSATEAINWALKGTIERMPPHRNRIVTIATEHAAVLDSCEWLEAQGMRGGSIAGRAGRAGRARLTSRPRSTSGWRSSRRCWSTMRSA